MMRLGVSVAGGGPVAGLQELRDSDLCDLKGFIDERRYTGGSRELPWIWRSLGSVELPGASDSVVQHAIESWEEEG